jgi:hypothetical protein
MLIQAAWNTIRTKGRLQAPACPSAGTRHPGQAAAPTSRDRQAQGLEVGTGSPRHAKASSDQQYTEFVAVQRDGVGLVVQPRLAYVGSLRASYWLCAGAQAE